MGPWNWRWTKLGNFQFWGNVAMEYFFLEGVTRVICFEKEKVDVPFSFPRWSLLTSQGRQESKNL